MLFRSAVLLLLPGASFEIICKCEVKCKLHPTWLCADFFFLCCALWPPLSVPIHMHLSESSYFTISFLFDLLSALLCGIVTEDVEVLRDSQDEGGGQTVGKNMWKKNGRHEKYRRRDWWWGQSWLFCHQVKGQIQEWNDMNDNFFVCVAIRFKQNIKFIGDKENLIVQTVTFFFQKCTHMKVK